MNVHERRNVFVHQMTTETPFCVNCVYYYPHYIRESRSGRYTPIYSGHCVHPRMKPRKAYDTCENFKNRREEELTENDRA